MNAPAKTALGQIPPPSTAILPPVELVHNGREVAIRFRYDDDGAVRAATVAFERPRAIAWRAEGHCTAWHIEGAYDTIAEVTPSAWIEELTQAQGIEHRGKWQMRHFMLFLDGAGCYEVVAADFEVRAQDQ